MTSLELVHGLTAASVANDWSKFDGLLREFFVGNQAAALGETKPLPLLSKQSGEQPAARSGVIHELDGGGWPDDAA